MKKHIHYTMCLLLLTMWYTSFAQPQQLTDYQYWFDGDYSRVQNTTIPANTSLTLNDNIDMSSLDYGLHYVSYRFKDERGAWSVPQSQFFSYYENVSSAPKMQEIIAYQYWIDGDYTTVQTKTVGATATLALSENIDVSTLEHGLHYVTYRFKDKNNQWSMPQSQFFSYYENVGSVPKMQNIVAYEYWINGDYTTAQTTAVGATASLTINETVDIAALSDGLNHISYRFKDERGYWSVPQSQFFSYHKAEEVLTEPLKIMAYRYWIDTDINTVVTTDVASPTATYTLSEAVDLPQDISGGQHSITFQFKDEHNDWSVPMGGTFSKTYEPRGSITADENPVCKDKSVQFSASTIDVDAITWDFGDGTATETTLSPTHTYTKMGTYSITAIFTHTPTNKTATATMTITVKGKTAPSFTQVAAICEGDVLAALPTSSNDGVKGTWLPALDNTQTTEYTFTPDAGQCATPTKMTIRVNKKTVPTFTQVATICEGDALAALPTTSDNGVKGSWSPALDNTQTTEYTFTPADGECATTVTMTVSVLPVKKNTLEVAVCDKDLPYTFGNQKLTKSGIYSETFQAANGCDSIVKLKLTVATEITPTFTQIAAICEGDALPALPTTSDNGIKGTWSPALDNTQTTAYTFTPANTDCTTTATMTITVNQKTVPTFTQVATICKGNALAALPTTSDNGIKGTWSPAVDNTKTTLYTFTPADGECATTTTMTITVNQKTVPAFTQVATICKGDALAALPTISQNGIKGSWSPDLDNMQTTAYTFMPDAGQCATYTTMTIAVELPKHKQKTVTVCEGQLPYQFGKQSLAQGGTYTETFQTVNGCDSIVNLTLVVNARVQPDFTQLEAVCQGKQITLPQVSNNGIYGSWSPSFNSQETTSYIFTPNDTDCAETASMRIEILPKISPKFAQVAAICEGETLAALPTTSQNGIEGTWSPALDNMQTTEYTFSPADGECATTAKMTITVNSKTVPVFTQVASICEGDALAALPTTSQNGIEGTWSPALDNMQTTEYTFTPTDRECATTAKMTITVALKKHTTITKKICASELPYQLGTQQLTKSGVYTETFQAVNGCDSIVTLTLEVNELTVPQIKVVAQPDCENDKGYFEIANYDSRFSYTISPRQGVAMDKQNITAPQGTYVLTAKFGDCEEQSAPIVVTKPLSKPTVVTHPITVTLPQVADLTQAAVTEGSSPNLTFTYWLDAAATKQLSNPDAVTDSGVYYLKGENTEGCSAIAAIEITVIKFQPIVVVDDIVETIFEKSVSIDVGANDSFRESDGDDDNFSIVAQPLHGTVTEKSDGIFVYLPDAGFIGEDTFSYQLCNRINQCSEGKVKITVKLPKISAVRKINVKELLTPNGDNSNDEWFIKDLQIYSLAKIPNKVMLFNREGLKVYEKENYLLDGKAFKGFGNTSKVNKNELLPKGVYFYVVTVEGRKEQTGYLYILY